MARSRSRATAPAASTRRPTARSRKESVAPAAVEVEVVEEERGLGIDDGILIVTFLMIFVAFLMVDYDRGVHYGQGLFFK